jgi:hypothetical protein
MKLDWQKKTKKKKWTEDDDKGMVEKYRATLSEKLKAQIFSVFDGLENRDPFIRILNLLQNKKKPELSYFEHLIQKKPLKDMDIEGKRVLLKINLKVASTPEAQAKKLEHEQNIIKAKEEEEKRILEQKLLEE